MTLDHFLSVLRARNVRLHATGDRLRCEAPPGVLTPELQEELSARKEEILHLLRRSDAVSGGNARIPPADRSEPLPLSFIQQRLCFLDRFIGDSAVYNVPLALRLRGTLDADRLARALTEVVHRHEALRTSFHDGQAGMYQRVLAPRPVELPVTDLRATPADERWEQLQSLMKSELPRRFDLASGNLLRARLFALTEDEHVLLLVLHHIACDAWSLNILVDELTNIYASDASAGVSLPAPPIQYPDYAMWQRRRSFAEGRLNKLLTRYAFRLAGSTTGTVITGDRPRPPVQTYNGARIRVPLARELLEPLRRLAAEEGASLFMALLAVAKVLLFRYTRQDEISVGVPMTARQRPELQSVVGCFLNTLVLRTRVAAGMSGRELLRAVRETCLEAYEFEEVPFEKLVESLESQRDLSYNPLFQILFFVQSEPVRDYERASLHWHRLDVENLTAKFDLSFEIEEVGEGAVLILRYNRDLFEAATIERMMGHYRSLLAALGADPQVAIGRVKLLQSAEERQLEAWNAHALEEMSASCVQQMFEMQVQRTPEAIALASDTERLSYRELNERANRLAHFLLARDTGPEQLVGIYCRRTPEMVVGILGVLKAGAAYIPVDPTYPRDRVALMLEDAGVRIVLTQKDLATSLPVHDAAVIALDDPAAGIAGASALNPPQRTEARHLSHVIYTSGSTGLPKGIMIEHRNVLALLQWAHRTYAPDELRGVLASTSICFDLSVFELFAPLTAGGTVHLIENALHLPQYAARDEVTLINTVPSAIAHLLRSAALPPSVRVVNLAGEPLPRSVVDLCYDQPHVQAVYNLYGPSEDTTYSTCLRVDRNCAEEPSIGWPLPGKQVRILDGDLQPVPVGVLGEIYIGGAGVARGYHNRPELNAERFIANPFGEGRLYRTGDLGRYLPDGQIAYFGRTDFQVKLRGFRIELGEIEAELRRHPSVRDTVVAIRQDAGSDPVLVAYIVPALQPLDLPKIKAHLRSTLPAFMQPSVIVLLQSLPMTPNGKIDRAALPAPARERREVEEPRMKTTLELSIAGIWRDLLHAEQIGIDDNFFEIGGHSLLVLEMHSRLRTLIQREIPIVELFRHPTIRSLSEFLSAEPDGKPSFNHLTARAQKQKAMLAKRRNTISARRT